MENLINQFETIQIVDEQINYQHYNFLCQCEEKFSSFAEFKSHLQAQHNCQNLQLAYLTAGKNNTNWKIKFFWTFTCKNRSCQNKFSSSLCNADLKVSGCNINIVKKWKLQCRKCRNYANFDHETLLDSFLRERVQQKLIYTKYRANFASYQKDNSENRKQLKNHQQSLCEKCKSLGRYCADT